MRYLITLAFCFLLLSPQAHACRDRGDTLFFEAIPNPQPDADLIAKVSLSDVSEETKSATVTVTVTVMQVLKTSDARFQQGEKIAMKYQFSSCGPNAINGSKGMIIAKTGTDSKGSLVLHPYTYRYRDGRIEPPAILPDGFTMSLEPLRIGEDIPQNFAAILIGVAGAESVDNLQFHHSAQPSMSASFMDARFPALSNTIVAIAIPVGIKQLSIDYITTGRRRAGYRPNDTVGVHTPKLDIDRPGFYYVATLDTDNPGQFQATPLPEQLKQFRADYVGTVERLKPINFKWPGQ